MGLLRQHLKQDARLDRVRVRLPDLVGVRSLVFLPCPSLCLNLGHIGDIRRACKQTDQTHRCRLVAWRPPLDQFPPEIEPFAMSTVLIAFKSYPAVAFTKSPMISAEISLMSLFGNRSWIPLVAPECHNPSSSTSISASGASLLAVRMYKLNERGRCSNLVVPAVLHVLHELHDGGITVLFGGRRLLLLLLGHRLEHLLLAPAQARAGPCSIDMAAGLN